jgi:pilus assembly protein CpaE
MTNVTPLRPNANSDAIGDIDPQSDAEMARRNVLRSDQRMEVLLVSQDASLNERIYESFESKNYFALRSLKGALNEIEDFAKNGATPSLAIIDLNAANATELETLARLKKTKFQKTPTIILSEYLDEYVVRQLVRMRVDDWLPKDSPAEEIYDSCERALHTEIIERRDHQATCYAFYPAAGGVGNTTLAIQTAFMLGEKRGRMSSTCLVDLNLQDGVAADYLDLLPAFQPEEIANTPGRLDRQLLDVMMVRHSSGLALLAAPRVSGQTLDITEGLIASVLGLVSETFDNIVIDMPKTWFPWTDNVLWGSDKVFVVSNFSVPALRHASYVLDTLKTKTSGKSTVSVLVNRFRKKMFSSGLMQRDVEQLIGKGLAGFVRDEPEVVQEAINRGVPLQEINRSNRVAKDLEPLIFDNQ